MFAAKQNYTLFILIFLLAAIALEKITQEASNTVTYLIYALILCTAVAFYRKNKLAKK